MKTIQELQGEITALREEEKKHQAAIGRVSSMQNLMREIPAETLQAVGIEYGSTMDASITREIDKMQAGVDSLKKERKTLATAMGMLKKAERILG